MGVDDLHERLDGAGHFARSRVTLMRHIGSFRAAAGRRDLAKTIKQLYDSDSDSDSVNLGRSAS
jgi:hypothetical protein